MSAMPVSAAPNAAHGPSQAPGDSVEASVISRDAAGTVRIHSDAVLRGLAMSAGLESAAAMGAKGWTGTAGRLNRRPNSTD